MRILFVQPGFPEITNEYPPIGLLYLASVSRGAGYVVDFYDASAERESFPKALEYCIDFEPDILAMSLYTVGLVQQYAFIKRVKKSIPKCVVIVGGPHATALPEYTMEECPEIDFLAYGEGERTLVELLSFLKKEDKALHDIKGIYYRNEEQITKNESQPLLDNLNSIPFPAFDLIKKHSFRYARRAFEIYQNKGTIITSRGCPSKCEFCFKATFGSIVRRRSPQNVAAEMAWQIKEFGVEEFQFVDDLFTANPRWLGEFFVELKENRIDVPWKCLSRVNTVKEDDIQAMKRHGCYGIEFGVESGNDEILKDIKKGITTEQVKRAFKTSRKYGLLTFGFFIFGHRRDNHKTIMQTFEFAKEISPDLPGFAMLSPFPGSKVYELLDEDRKRNWNAFAGYYDKNSLPLSVCSVSAENLKKYSEQAEAEFYGSLCFLFKNILFRKGIRYAHRVELFEKWRLSLKVVNRLYREKIIIFNKKPFFCEYVINLILILLSEILNAMAMVKGRLLVWLRRNVVCLKGLV